MRSFLMGAAALLTAMTATALPAQRAYQELAVSPDGRMMASVEGDAPPAGGSPVVRELMIRSLDGRSEISVRLPCGAVPECWPSALAWTADAQHLSFALRTPGSHARSVYRVDANGGHLEQTLAFDGTLKGLHYSANGTLAMLATPGATKEVGAVEAGSPLTGDIDAESPVQRLAVLEPGARALRWISPAGLYVYEFDGLPDGSGYVGTAAQGDGDRNWWIAKLHAFAANGQSDRILYTPQTAREQLATPRVSPDGRRVAMIVGLMSDFGSTGGDIYLLPLEGGAAQNLTAQQHASVTDINWRSDGHLMASVLAADLSQRVDFGIATAPGAGQAIWSGAAPLRDISAASGKSTVEAGVMQDFNHAPEIFVSDERSLKALTHRNSGLTHAFVVRSLKWHNEGFDIQGWLVLPAAASATSGTGSTGKRPMIVEIHGGPAGVARPRFINAGDSTHALLERGYAIFYPNPRGSFGQGEAFTQANAKDFGGADLRDILSGVDAAIQQAGIDPERLGITGHSYGGYMTMWAVTQTTRFKAAVAGAGLANWQSYYGQNGINEWMIPYFGASVYDDPAVYAKSSPINFIRKVKTPTFSFVGEADIECPAAQTLEFGRALQILGVPALTVLYPGEGHALRGPKTREDIERRTLAWFDRYLKP
ncbi:MAG TPA: S9 family peptidase [Burkholderiaceae bacterium]|jgi:dipeptidyl aminopeptidase/acylaminoacyl peptidase